MNLDAVDYINHAILLLETVGCHTWEDKFVLLHRKLDVLEALNRFDECLHLIGSMESQSLKTESSLKLLTLVKEFGCDDISSQFYVTGGEIASTNISGEDGLCFAEKMAYCIASRKSQIEYRLRTMR